MPKNLPSHSENAKADEGTKLVTSLATLLNSWDNITL